MLLLMTQNAEKHCLEGKNHAGEKACTGASDVEEMCSDSKEEPLSFGFLSANPEKLEKLDATELRFMQRKRSKPTTDLTLLPMYQSDSLAILAVYCLSLYTSAYVSICQHMSAYVSIRQHTSACVSMRQHASAYASIRQHTPAYASIRQHTPAYASIRQHTEPLMARSPSGVSIFTFVLVKPVH
jgi:hypothetical protein